MRQHSYLLLALSLGALALSAGLVGCDSANPVAPSGSTITVTANPTLIGLSESSTITVTGFKPDGNPLNPGSQVNLTTDLGVLDATIVSIDNNGRATTVLRADGRPGAATVTATLPTGEASATVTVTIGEADVQPSLAITASPDRINIEQESNISLIARNVDGSFLSGGRVRLRTSLGTLDEESLVTDMNGEAETIMRPEGRSGTADLTGSVDSGMEVTSQVTIIQSQVIVDINSNVIDITDTAEVTILVRDEDGISLVERHEVRLTANLGTLDPTTVRTNRQGEAVSTYTAGTRAGSDTITAFFGNATPGTDTVTLRTAPVSIILTADTTTIAPNTNSTIGLTAVVTDAEGLLLANEVVSFSLSAGISGTFLPGRTDTTDSGGVSSVTVEFESTTAPAVGTVFTITAAARGENIDDSVTITVQ